MRARGRVRLRVHARRRRAHAPFFARAPREPHACPPVTIVKPLHGVERTLFANLASFCEQRYDGPIQFLFGVHDRDDPALRAVDALRTAFPART